MCILDQGRTSLEPLLINVSVKHGASFHLWLNICLYSGKLSTFTTHKAETKKKKKKQSPQHLPVGSRFIKWDGFWIGNIVGTKVAAAPDCC